MYDFSGIWYNIIILLIFVVLSLLIIISEKLWESTFIWKSKKLLTCIFCIIGCCLLLLFYLNVLNNPTIDVFVGVKYKQYGRRGMDICYYFESSNGETKALYLNHFTKRRILPNGFEENIEYIVHYETITRTIVKIER